MGTLLTKFDLKDTYRIIPVHPSDHHRLGIMWEGATYVDRCLPFGLRSAPKIFSDFSDALAWIFGCAGLVSQVHYLDDFLYFEPSGSPGVLSRRWCLRFAPPWGSHWPHTKQRALLPALCSWVSWWALFDGNYDCLTTNYSSCQP